MKVWATKIILRAENETIETRIKNYLTGVLQGDCLSLLLFIHCQPIIVSIEEPTWLQNWRAWKKRYKPFTPVFCR